ncbi:unnamed protein product [Vitrella brassicaformis CCMP3155]|uniref:TORTIFOLIA1/SINE1-2 N-terminal domain-containing protein n=3 Tax=Vitrella brassicaformis TaxID=1169539 RepID=A0A0G4EUQ4_VITBC|nr:unnamed protein product [Vitrella brassicaformis CCMP3155]|eukprot:CEM01973.1 unnamed protein product [Vitrella brassicaformis CCMP3155]
MDAPRSHELALAKQQCEAEMRKDIDKMLGRMADCDTVHVGHHDISEFIKRIEPHLLIKTLALVFECLHPKQLRIQRSPMIKRESVRAYSMIVQQHPVFCYNHHTTILKSIFEGLLDRLQDGTQEHADTHMNTALDKCVSAITRTLMGLAFPQDLDGTPLEEYVTEGVRGVFQSLTRPLLDSLPSSKQAKGTSQPKCVQIGAATCLTAVIKNCPAEMLLDQQPRLVQRLITVIRTPEHLVQAKPETLLALTHLYLSVGREGFSPALEGVLEAVPVCLDVTTAVDWRTRRAAIELIQAIGTEAVGRRANGADLWVERSQRPDGDTDLQKRLRKMVEPLKGDKVSNVRAAATSCLQLWSSGGYVDLKDDKRFKRANRGTPGTPGPSTTSSQAGSLRGTSPISVRGTVVRQVRPLVNPPSRFHAAGGLDGSGAIMPHIGVRSGVVGGRLFDSANMATAEHGFITPNSKSGLSGMHGSRSGASLHSRTSRQLDTSPVRMAQRSLTGEGPRRDGVDSMMKERDIPAVRRESSDGYSRPIQYHPSATPPALIMPPYAPTPLPYHPGHVSPVPISYPYPAAPLGRPPGYYQHTASPQFALGGGGTGGMDGLPMLAMQPHVTSTQGQGGGGGEDLWGRPITPTEAADAATPSSPSAPPPAPLDMSHIKKGSLALTPALLDACASKASPVVSSASSPPPPAENDGADGNKDSSGEGGGFSSVRELRAAALRERRKTRDREKGGSAPESDALRCSTETVVFTGTGTGAENEKPSDEGGVSAAEGPDASPSSAASVASDAAGAAGGGGGGSSDGLRGEGEGQGDGATQGASDGKDKPRTTDKRKKERKTIFQPNVGFFKHAAPPPAPSDGAASGSVAAEHINVEVREPRFRQSAPPPPPCRSPPPSEANGDTEGGEEGNREENGVAVEMRSEQAVAGTQTDAAGEQGHDTEAPHDEGPPPSHSAPAAPEPATETAPRQQQEQRASSGSPEQPQPQDGREGEGEQLQREALHDDLSTPPARHEQPQESPDSSPPLADDSEEQAKPLLQLSGGPSDVLSLDDPSSVDTPSSDKASLPMPLPSSLTTARQDTFDRDTADDRPLRVPFTARESFQSMSESLRPPSEDEVPVVHRGVVAGGGARRGRSGLPLPPSRPTHGDLGEMGMKPRASVAMDAAILRGMRKEMDELRRDNMDLRKKVDALTQQLSKLEGRAASSDVQLAKAEAELAKYEATMWREFVKKDEHRHTVKTIDDIRRKIDDLYQNPRVPQPERQPSPAPSPSPVALTARTVRSTAPTPSPIPQRTAVMPLTAPNTQLATEQMALRSRQSAPQAPYDAAPSDEEGDEYEMQEGEDVGPPEGLRSPLLWRASPPLQWDVTQSASRLVVQGDLWTDRRNSAAMPSSPFTLTMMPSASPLHPAGGIGITRASPRFGSGSPPRQHSESSTTTDQAYSVAVEIARKERMDEAMRASVQSLPAPAPAIASDEGTGLSSRLGAWRVPMANDVAQGEQTDSTGVFSSEAAKAAAAGWSPATQMEFGRHLSAEDWGNAYATLMSVGPAVLPEDWALLDDLLRRTGPVPHLCDLPTNSRMMRRAINVLTDLANGTHDPLDNRNMRRTEMMLAWASKALDDEPQTLASQLAVREDLKVLLRKLIAAPHIEEHMREVASDMYRRVMMGEGVGEGEGETAAGGQPA